MTIAEKAELASIILGAVAALFGGREAVARGLAWWAQRKVDRDARELEAQKEIALARIHAEQHDAAREERTEERLWARVDTLDRRLDECEEKHRETERRSEECERRSKAQADEIVELRGHVMTLQEITLRDDDTGRILLERATRSTPPAPLNLPRPKRRREGDS